MLTNHIRVQIESGNLLINHEFVPCIQNCQLNKLHLSGLVEILGKAIPSTVDGPFHTLQNC